MKSPGYLRLKIETDQFHLKINLYEKDPEPAAQPYIIHFSFRK
jgi:hypothetical protein